MQIQCSQSSAAQRAGRAGRLGPGHCFRCWSAKDHAQRPQALQPEMLRNDVLPAVLEAAQWGDAACARLPLLDAPSPEAWQQALRVLQDMGALERVGDEWVGNRRLAEMSSLPMHPRHAYMIARRVSCLNITDGLVGSVMPTSVPCHAAGNVQS